MIAVVWTSGPLYFEAKSSSVCLMVGSNPAQFKDLAEETKLPEDRQTRVRQEISVLRVAGRTRTGDQFVIDHRRGGPRAPRRRYINAFLRFSRPYAADGTI